MTKFKKLTALLAVGMLGIQLMGAGTALAKRPGGGTLDGDCDFGSNDLEVTLGDSGDVAIWVDADGLLQCEAGNDSDDSAAVASIDSITVVMDSDESVGELFIYLSDDTTGGGAGNGHGHGGNNTAGTNASEWPDFETFDIDVTTQVHVDGSSVDDGAANSLRVTLGAKTLAFSGTTATYTAPSFEILGGARFDYLDASKAAVKVEIDGGAGKDSIKGGSKNDSLTGGTEDDVIYGGAGNDTIECGDDGLDQGWGGDGYDDISGCAVAAPGAGDDIVSGAAVLSYADLSDGVEYYNLAGDPIATDGAAGIDEIIDNPLKVYGSQGDDILMDDTGAFIRGYGGDDVIKVYGDGDNTTKDVEGGTGDDLIVAFDGGGDNLFYGQAGDDVLKGKDGDDTLRGGTGKDQSWGGSGSGDLCTAEVLNRCELIKH